MNNIIIRDGIKIKIDDDFIEMILKKAIKKSISAIAQVNDFKRVLEESKINPILLKLTEQWDMKGFDRKFQEKILLSAKIPVMFSDLYNIMRTPLKLSRGIFISFTHDIRWANYRKGEVYLIAIYSDNFKYCKTCSVNGMDNYGGMNGGTEVYAHDINIPSEELIRSFISSSLSKDNFNSAYCLHKYKTIYRIDLKKYEVE